MCRLFCDDLVNFFFCLGPGLQILLCPVYMTSCVCHLSKGQQSMLSMLWRAHTMYLCRSFSLSCWNRRRSFKTPEEASLTSLSDTSRACSNCRWLALPFECKYDHSPEQYSLWSCLSGLSASSQGRHPQTHGQRALCHQKYDL